MDHEIEELNALLIQDPGNLTAKGHNRLEELCQKYNVSNEEYDEMEE